MNRKNLVRAEAEPQPAPDERRLILTLDWLG
ncbi:hypothetical protein HK44_013170 [Pseudomonas fluorescens HK44]|uniref:Uncharacterized protein n=1 Tax=Pseudomonas fluorescens HK44 TaxID=1042209 RepID=A0A010SM13_PSEFL|nr:hypothetical protein HK44_013170 [Pseudomonas fluorescens HK44]